MSVYRATLSEPSEFFSSFRITVEFANNLYCSASFELFDDGGKKEFKVLNVQLEAFSPTCNIYVPAKNANIPDLDERDFAIDKIHGDIDRYNFLKSQKDLMKEVAVLALNRIWRYVDNLNNASKDPFAASAPPEPENVARSVDALILAFHAEIGVYDAENDVYLDNGDDAEGDAEGDDAEGDDAEGDVDRFEYYSDDDDYGIDPSEYDLDDGANFGEVVQVHNAEEAGDADDANADDSEAAPAA